MAKILQLRRGNLRELPTLQSGEVGVTLDTERLFIGMNSKNKEFCMKNGATITLLPGDLDGAGKTAEVTVNGVNAKSNIYIGLSEDASAAQITAYGKALVRATAQDENSITFTALKGALSEEITLNIMWS